MLELALSHLGGVESPQGTPFDTAFTDRRAVVHQAAGMVSVQLDLTVTDALARLRGYAYAQNRRLADICADVVARRLSFTRDSIGKGESRDEHG